MRFLSVGQEAEGFIAFGQIATGVIAIGQSATGVIAIGQLARGVVAVGMIAVGLVSFGMLTGGLVLGAGMVGVGGRAWGTGRIKSGGQVVSESGAVLPLVPVPRRRPRLPELLSLDAIRASGVEGWTEARLQLGSSGAPELVHDGLVLPVTIDPSLLGSAMQYASLRPHVIAQVVPDDGELRVVDIKVVPRPKWIQLVAARSLQLASLVAFAYLYWRFVLIDVGNVAVRAGRAFLEGTLQ